jgi:hypothetical protein
MALDGQMPHLCEVHRPRAVPDAYGAEKLLWPPDVPVHLADVRGRLIVKDQRVGAGVFAERPIITTYTYLTMPRQDIRQGDRIANVQDKQGVVETGPFLIDKVLARRRRTAISHLSLKLEKLG